MSESLVVLSFESSCDDTSVALLRVREDFGVNVLSMAVQSQDEVHHRYGGVVPELASRAHLSNLIPCLKKTLDESGHELSDVNLFVGTSHPGLIGSLLVGHSAAKTLSFIFEKPFVSANHLEGHIFSIFLEQKLEFPYLALVVSGGHSSIYRVDSFGVYEAIGLTLDDAAGEAFDKAAKMLGLAFPGGAELEKLARSGDGDFYKFGKVNVPNLHFSFSGLKSEFSRLVQREAEKLRASDAAASFQKAILDHIESRVAKAAKETGISRLCVVGGVARNQELRGRLNQLTRQGVLRDFHAPQPLYCTDNAAMTGLVGAIRFFKNQTGSLEDDVSSTSRPSRMRIRREKKA